MRTKILLLLFSFLNSVTLVICFHFNLEFFFPGISNSVLIAFCSIKTLHNV